MLDANGACPNGNCPLKQPPCPSCGTRLVNGACPNAACPSKLPPPPKCVSCNTQLVNGVCPNPSCPTNAKQDWFKYAILGLGFLVLVAIVLAIVLKPSKPRCPSCGAQLVNGACPNPDCPSKPHCPKCGSKLVNGVCPNCPPPPPPPQGCKSCGRTGVPLDKDGLCEDCRGTSVPAPVFLENIRPEDTIVPSSFGLKVLAPACWEGRTITTLPRRFEVGRKTPAGGMPFLRLNMNDPQGVERPGADRCSRRYIRVTEGEGVLNIDLITDSGNECVVDGKTLSAKGESAVAKAGSVITLNPDWKFEVVSASK